VWGVWGALIIEKNYYHWTWSCSHHSSRVNVEIVYALSELADTLKRRSISSLASVEAEGIKLLIARRQDAAQTPRPWTCFVKVASEVALGLGSVKTVLVQIQAAAK
jgi:hypothetical protein